MIPLQLSTRMVESTEFSHCGLWMHPYSRYYRPGIRKQPFVSSSDQPNIFDEYSDPPCLLADMLAEKLADKILHDNGSAL